MVDGYPTYTELVTNDQNGQGHERYDFLLCLSQWRKTGNTGCAVYGAVCRSSGTKGIDSALERNTGKGTFNAAGHFVNAGERESQSNRNEYPKLC